MATDIGTGKYETVAASQTGQVLGGAGAKGDFLKRLIIIPATVAGGLVTLIDGATSIPIYVGGGTSAAVDVKPFVVELGMASQSGAWSITTGANISVIAVGDFS